MDAKVATPAIQNASVSLCVAMAGRTLAKSVMIPPAILRMSIVVQLATLATDAFACSIPLLPPLPHQLFRAPSQPSTPPRNTPAVAFRAPQATVKGLQVRALEKEEQPPRDPSPTEGTVVRDPEEGTVVRDRTEGPVARALEKDEEAAPKGRTADGTVARAPEEEDPRDRMEGAAARALRMDEEVEKAAMNGKTRTASMQVMTSCRSVWILHYPLVSAVPLCSRAYTFDKIHIN